MVTNKENIGIKTKDEIVYKKITELPILDRYASGTNIIKAPILDAFKESVLISKDKEEEIVAVTKEISNVSLKEVDERIMTIDGLLDEFETKKK